MSKKPLIKQYDVNTSLDKLKELCHEAGGPKNVFSRASVTGHDSSLEDDISPWLPNYSELKAYKNIKAFQRALGPSEREKHQRCLERVKALLHKVPAFDKAQQGIRLREEGMQVCDICWVLGVSQGWYNNHCRHQVRFSKPMFDIEIVILKLEEDVKQREVERGRY
ncbi:hypothetical protein PS395_08705 [Limosilactobacillus pontis]|uniref:hypothetical protein n=1 Tax=Limosilactobacillus pontis TaxID=35787 RepID=UPI002F26187C